MGAYNNNCFPTKTGSWPRSEQGTCIPLWITKRHNHWWKFSDSCKTIPLQQQNKQGNRINQLLIWFWITILRDRFLANIVHLVVMCGSVHSTGDLIAIRPWTVKQPLLQSLHTKHTFLQAYQLIGDHYSTTRTCLHTNRFAILLAWEKFRGGRPQKKEEIEFYRLFIMTTQWL